MNPPKVLDKIIMPRRAKAIPASSSSTSSTDIRDYLSRGNVVATAKKRGDKGGVVGDDAPPRTWYYHRQPSVDAVDVDDNGGGTGSYGKYLNSRIGRRVARSLPPDYSYFVAAAAVATSATRANSNTSFTSPTASFAASSDHDDAVPVGDGEIAADHAAGAEGKNHDDDIGAAAESASRPKHRKEETTASTTTTTDNDNDDDEGLSTRKKKEAEDTEVSLGSRSGVHNSNGGGRGGRRKRSERRNYVGLYILYYSCTHSFLFFFTHTQSPPQKIYIYSYSKKHTQRFILLP